MTVERMTLEEYQEAVLKTPKEIFHRLIKEIQNQKKEREWENMKIAYQALRHKNVGPENERDREVRWQVEDLAWGITEAWGVPKEAKEYIKYLRQGNGWVPYAWAMISIAAEAIGWREELTPGQFADMVVPIAGVVNLGEDLAVTLW